jgi:solute carrier family 25 protein 38
MVDSLVTSSPNLTAFVTLLSFKSNFYNYKSMGEAVRSIVKEQGIRGLFSGWGATAMRDAPFAGLYVMFYENCKPTMKRTTSTQHTIPAMSF